MLPIRYSTVRTRFYQASTLYRQAGATTPSKVSRSFLHIVYQCPLDIGLEALARSRVGVSACLDWSYLLGIQSIRTWQELTRNRWLGQRPVLGYKLQCRRWSSSKVQSRYIPFFGASHRGVFPGCETTQVHTRSRLDLLPNTTWYAWYTWYAWSGPAARPSCSGHSQYLPGTNMHSLRPPKPFP